MLQAIKISLFGLKQREPGLLKVKFSSMLITLKHRAFLFVKSRKTFLHSQFEFDPIANVLINFFLYLFYYWRVQSQPFSVEILSGLVWHHLLIKRTNTNGRADFNLANWRMVKGYISLISKPRQSKGCASVENISSINFDNYSTRKTFGKKKALCWR